MVAEILYGYEVTKDDVALGCEIARFAFAKRGNKTEMHLSEKELAALLAGAAVIARNRAERKMS